MDTPEFAARKTMRLTTRVTQNTVVVEVADTGCGMPPDVAARAFEPFFTTKDAATNTGLGLDIARRVAEESGGTLTIGRSASGGGCVTLGFGPAAGLLPKRRHRRAGLLRR